MREDVNKIKSVAILGLGLMGGSLGLALRRQAGVRVTGFARRADTRRLAVKMGAVDVAFEHPAQAVEGAALAVLCVPVNLIAELAATCAPGLSDNAVVTDVGSSKAAVVSRLDDFFSGGAAHFVGSHPITGSEQHGLEAARADLYDDATVVTTPSTATSPAALRLVEDFWRMLGARVCQTPPEEHDRLLAATSHLPHLVASVLAATVGRRTPEHTGAFCGAGFWDTTRVADGDPGIWHDIIHSNRAAVAGELRAFQEKLAELAAAVEKSDFAAVRGLLAEGQVKRRALGAVRPGKPGGKGARRGPGKDGCNAKTN